MRRSASIVRRGVTIIELIVALAIISLLFALIVPAVQSSRESMRRLSCQAKMRDVALAWRLASEATDERIGPVSSIFFELASYLDIGEVSFHHANQPGVPQAERRRFSAAISPRLSCPSDGRVTPAEGNYSFTFNRGIDHLYGDGVMTRGGLVQPDEFPDGASTTLLMSERVVPYGSGPENATILTDDAVRLRDPLLHLWYLERDFSFLDRGASGENGLLADWADCVQATKTMRTGLLPLFIRNGQRAIGSFPSHPSFGTFATPNTPACFPLKSRPGRALAQQHYDEVRILDPPTSRHRSGVNVAMGDGSARFLSDEIDMRLWIRMGTRSSEETKLPGF